MPSMLALTLRDAVYVLLYIRTEISLDMLVLLALQVLF